MKHPTLLNAGIGYLTDDYKKPESFKQDSSSGIIPPGRLSVPNETLFTINNFRSATGLAFVDTKFRREVIPLIRDLYKTNPDVGVALQEIFKLANTGHQIIFPYNNASETKNMLKHLSLVTDSWSNYTAGIDGLVNRFISQFMVGGAISIEGVPKSDLTGISTIIFVNPEDIMFQREADGVYMPYQINKSAIMNDQYIKLNTNTFSYISMFNDTDEPYGIPPFITVLESIRDQRDMKLNFKQVMSLLGMIGFLEASMEKPSKESNESEPAYRRRLTNTLTQLKAKLMVGMKDGLVVGYKDDHEFNMTSTTKDLSNLDKVWAMNQQSVANGLGGMSSLIGVQKTTTEGGAGVLLSKMISQLKTIQMNVAFALQKLYMLELKLAGFNVKSVSVKFAPTTVADNVKIQQANEYKIRNLSTLRDEGIIDQYQYAYEMGYSEPAESGPVKEFIDAKKGSSANNNQASSKKVKRKDQKTKSDRRSRDKVNPAPKPNEQNPKER